MKKDNKESHSGETFAIIAIVAALIALILTITSCGTEAQSTPHEDEKVYISINGENVELVADEYDNQYLKEFIGNGSYIYIPYPGETDDDSDTLRFYNAKN